jgi:hypothetical protein
MANGLIGQLEGLARSTTEFSCALAVFGLSQGGKVFRYWPTSQPTAPAIDSFTASTATLKAQYDGVDSALFNACNGVGQAALASAFALLDPANWTPQSLAQTTVNLVRFGIGQAVQLIPGGTVGVGGPPEGWGPVNPADGARLSYGG